VMMTTMELKSRVGIVLTMILFFSVAVVSAQPFQKKFPITGMTGFSTIQKLSSGNLLIGATGRNNIIKTVQLYNVTQSGELNYTKQSAIGSEMDLYPQGMIMDGDSVVYTTWAQGTGGVGSATAHSVQVGKMDTLSNHRFNRRIQHASPGPRGGGIAIIKPTLSTGYVGCGWSNDVGISYAGQVFKIDDAGQVEWSHYLRVSPFEFIYGVAEASNGDYVFAAGSSAIYLSSFTSAGVLNWNYQYKTGTLSCGITAFKATPDNGFILVGTHRRPGYTDNDAFIMKLDESGNVLWAKRVGEDKNDSFASVIMTSDGGFLACGVTESYSTSKDGFLVKFDADGEVEWSRKYGDTFPESFNNVIETDNYYYAVGSYEDNTLPVYLGGSVFYGWLVATEKDGYIGCNEQVVVPTVSDASAITQIASPVVMTTAVLVHDHTTLISDFSSAVSDVCIPLPVSLVAFEGKYVQEQTILSWTTASEENNHYFTIERSLDAQQWEAIGRVDGNNNSRTLLHYTYTDTDVWYTDARYAYYRLKQTDYDGEVHYHPAIQIQAGNDRQTEYRIAPSPVEDRLLISTAQSVYPVSAVLYTTDGREILQATLSGIGEEIPVYHLAPGVYTLRITSAGGTPYVQRIVKK
jgi:hypothetical protein